MESPKCRVVAGVCLVANDGQTAPFAAGSVWPTSRGLPARVLRRPALPLEVQSLGTGYGTVDVRSCSRRPLGGRSAGRAVVRFGHPSAQLRSVAVWPRHRRRGSGRPRQCPTSSAIVHDCRPCCIAGEVRNAPGRPLWRAPVASANSFGRLAALRTLCRLRHAATGAATSTQSRASAVMLLATMAWLCHPARE